VVPRLPKISMDVDLHMHSRASDGTATPTEVVAAALNGRLDVISLTDHDTVAGVEESVSAAQGKDLQIIPGLEVSAHWHGVEIHILGYFVDLADPGLRAHGTWAGDRRLRRMESMVGRLRNLGVEVTMADVETEAGTSRKSLARPHLARALVRLGYVSSVPEAFDRYLGDALDVFEPTALLSPAEGIQLIRSAGGIAVWAHPPMDHVDALLPNLVEAGLRGLEVFRPRNPRDRTLQLERKAAAAGLLVTGGSDWHGPEGGELGRFKVPAQDIAEFLEEGGF
jgi:3',5'-nucleoside bisphosphate phosphatase